MSAKFHYKILKNKDVKSYISSHAKNIRIDVESGSDWSAHLEIFLRNKSGKVYFNTIGRIRKDLFKSLRDNKVIDLMDTQPGFINISHYKVL